MIPPVYQTLIGDPDVSAIVGQRVFGSGIAPQDASQPYVVWQVVSEVPENTLSCLPDSDNIRVQVDCYCTTESIARILATAVRDAMEPHAYLMLAWNGYEFGQEQTPSVKLFRWSMDFSWKLDR